MTGKTNGRAAHLLKVLAAAGGLALAAPAIASAADYEAVYVAGSAQTPFEFFRVATATGQVAFAAGAATAYTVVAEPSPLPPGDYHLYVASQPANAAGAVVWGLVRMDAKTGHTWTLTGGGPAALTWIDVAQPK